MKKINYMTRKCSLKPFVTGTSTKQLLMGKKVEMEHTNDPKLAVIIASHHLGEIPDYYTRLNRMEKRAMRK